MIHCCIDHPNGGEALSTAREVIRRKTTDDNSTTADSPLAAQATDCKLPVTPTTPDPSAAQRCLDENLENGICKMLKAN